MEARDIRDVIFVDKDLDGLPALDRELTLNELNERIRNIDVIYKRIICEFSEFNDNHTIIDYYIVTESKRKLFEILTELKLFLDSDTYNKIITILNEPLTHKTDLEYYSDPNRKNIFAKIKDRILANIYNYKYLLEVKRDVLLNKRPDTIKEYTSTATINDLPLEILRNLIRDYIKPSPLYAFKLRAVSPLWKFVLDDLNPQGIDLLTAYFGPMGAKSNHMHGDRHLVSFAQFVNPKQMICKYLNQIKYYNSSYPNGEKIDKDPKKLDQYELIFLDDNVALFKDIYMTYHRSNQNITHGFNTACLLGASNIVRYCLNILPKEDSAINYHYNNEVNTPCEPSWSKIIQFNHREILEILLPCSKEKFPRKINPPVLHNDFFAAIGSCHNIDLVILFLDAFKIVPSSHLILGVFLSGLAIDMQLEFTQRYLDQYEIEVDRRLLSSILLKANQKEEKIVIWFIEKYRHIFIDNIDIVNSHLTESIRKSWKLDDKVCQYIERELGLIDEGCKTKP